ncbi:MAG: hypothetical protein ACJA1W_003994, partial [Akkermansiaceae bacterium]
MQVFSSVSDLNFIALTQPIFNMPNLDPFILNGLLTLKIPSGTP